MYRIAVHSLIIVALTVITQIGGLAWLLALLTRRSGSAFVALYVTLSIAALWIAPMTGRVPLPCLSDGALKMQSPLYCALNRQYVRPPLKSLLEDYAAHMDVRYPGTQTLVLDGNFPFITGFPLLPHLSHDDGEKVDLAFYYAQDQAYLRGQTRSPLGYFAFEDGPTDCPDHRLSLRWDLDWLQPLWPDYTLETMRLEAGLEWLASTPAINKIFIEPHLKQSLGLTSPKIRFQGCRAARHDDHIHIQL